MSKILSRTSVLAAVLLCLVVLNFRLCADERRPDKLTLKSGYSGKVLIDGARQIYLSATLDEEGKGWGKLAFDPNIREGNTSTQIAIQEIPIELRLVRGEEQAAKGRRLYEVKRSTPLDPMGKAKEDGDHWFLVRPLKEGMPCWLVLAGKDGKVQDVLMLK